MARGILGTIGIGIMLFSGFFVATAIGDLTTGGDGQTRPGVLVGLLVVFGGLFLAGAYIAWRMFRASGAAAGGTDASGQASAAQPAPLRTEADRERAVLRFAEAERGRVTVPEVATACDLTIADSKTALDRLVLLGVATIQVTKSGVLVYVFPGFLSDEDKAKATDF